MGKKIRRKEGKLTNLSRVDRNQRNAFLLPPTWWFTSSNSKELHKIYITFVNFYFCAKDNQKNSMKAWGCKGSKQREGSCLVLFGHWQTNASNKVCCCRRWYAKLPNFSQTTSLQIFLTSSFLQYNTTPY